MNADLRFSVLLEIDSKFSFRVYTLTDNAPFIQTIKYQSGFETRIDASLALVGWLLTCNR